VICADCCCAARGKAVKTIASERKTERRKITLMRSFVRIFPSIYFTAPQAAQLCDLQSFTQTKQIAAMSKKFSALQAILSFDFAP
jgi:hypothetical protein